MDDEWDGNHQFSSEWLRRNCSEFYFSHTKYILVVRSFGTTRCDAASNTNGCMRASHIHRRLQSVCCFDGCYFTNEKQLVFVHCVLALGTDLIWVLSERIMAVTHFTHIRVAVLWQSARLVFPVEDGRIHSSWGLTAILTRPRCGCNFAFYF